jgi:predicted membrane-bound spermidine synthase
MGATLPLLTRHFVRQGGALGQRVGALYAVNTFGAVAGTFIAGFILLPGVGLNWTNAIAGFTNVMLAVLIVTFRKSLLGTEWPKSWRDLLPKEGRQFESVSTEASGSERISPDVSPEAERGAGKPESTTTTASKKRAKKTAATAKPVDSAAKSDGPAKQREEDLIEEPLSRTVKAAVLLAAAGSGFAALAYEQILTRALDMVIGSSIYSFTIILMAFLVGIGGGSAIASAILRSRPGPMFAMAIGGGFMAVALLQLIVYNSRLSLMIFVVTAIVVMLCLIVASTWRRPALALGAIQLLIGISAACTYYFQDKIPRMFVWLAMIATDSCDPSRPLEFSRHIGTIQVSSFVIATMCALPAAIGMGAAFPLSVRAYARNIATVGADTGTVYSVNTIGSIFGSFLTGFVIMPAVGMETAFYLAVAINLAIALALLLASPGDEPAKYVLVPITAILLAIAATGTVLGRDGRLARSQGRLAVFPKPWSQEMMTMGVFRLSLADGMISRRNNQCIESEESDREHGLGGDNPIFYRDGVTTTVTVERWSLGDRTHYALKNNGKVDASNGDDMPTQVLVSAYPLLLHRRGPENLDVAIVGWSSGMTVGTTLQFPVRHIDVIELERATIDASRFFTDVNHLEYNLRQFPFVSAPRLTVFNNDGRNYLGATHKRYDVIISEPSNPWITGVSNLFTVDHFRAASQALAPGGIYLQWVQLYEMSPNNIKTIYRTFAEVFPYVRVFAADAYSSDTIVLGSFSPIELNLARVDASLRSNPRALEAIRPSHAQTAADLFARMLFASNDEVRRFAQLEEHLENGAWRPRIMANGSGPCDPANCRRRPAPLNTDDNALIEFAAPRDLIGFDAFAGYTETLYGDEWPYGRVEQQLTGIGDGADRVNALSRLGVSLLSAGRPSRAGDVIDQAAAMHGPDGQPIRTPDLEHAAGVWAAMTSNHEPTLRLEPPHPGPDISREGERRLQEAYERAARALAESSVRTALAAFADIPVSVREHSGPALRLLYGYLLYKSSMAEGAEPRFGEAADELERLAREEPEWTLRHPEVMFYIGRSRFRAGDFALGVAALSNFVDMVRQPAARDHESVDVVRDVDEPSADNAPVSDEAGESVKDERAPR